MKILASNILVLFVASIAAQTAASSPQDDLRALNAASQGRSNEHRTVGRGGIVATEVDVCSNIGADLLKQGGSAADAIIGASFCVGSIDSFHSGIGGGGFILVRDQKKAHNDKHDGVRFIDMREMAPKASNETMYSANPNKKASTVGGLAVGVPGELRGFELLHKRYGKLPWKKVIEPIVKLNRIGYRVPNQLSFAIEQYKDTLLCNSTYFKEVYCANGTAVGLGDHIKKDRLAATFELLARDGVDAFYSGPLSNRTIETIQANGGIMTLDDLKSYKALEREPLSIDFPGKKKVWSTSAPSSGAVVLSSLKTMATYGSYSLNRDGVNLTTHRLIESTKFAYGERTEYGDPTFDKNVTRLQEENLSDKSTKEKRSSISDTKTHNVSYYDPSKRIGVTDHGTSHLVAIDAYGLSVTLTTTVNTLWGSQLMTPDGFILNNEMDDFSSPGGVNEYGYVPTAANFIRPGKRPLSSISPVIIVDQQTHKTIEALGSAGGSRIVTANIINSFNALNGINLQASIAMPRWHNQLQPATTSFEWAQSSDPTIPNWKGYDNSTVAFLATLGHNVSFVAPGSSTAQGASYAPYHRLFKGASEIRQLSARSAAI